MCKFVVPSKLVILGLSFFFLSAGKKNIFVMQRHKTDYSVLKRFPYKTHLIWGPPGCLTSLCGRRINRFDCG